MRLLKTLAAFALGGNLAVVPVQAQEPPLGNPTVTGPIDGFRQAESQKEAINKRIVAINRYGDDLQTGKATQAGWDACKRDLADLQSFVTRTSQQGAFASATVIGDKILATVVKNRLEEMDTNPCPSLISFGKFGNDAFTDTDKNLAQLFDDEEAGINRRVGIIQNYNQHVANGVATKDEQKSCFGSAGDLNDFIKKLADEEKNSGKVHPAERTLYEEIKTGLGKSFAKACPAPAG